MKKTYLLTIASLILLASSCQSPEDNPYQISKDSVEPHIMELASDEFMGRKPFTEGETIRSPLFPDLQIQVTDVFKGITE